MPRLHTLGCLATALGRKWLERALHAYINQASFTIGVAIETLSQLFCLLDKNSTGIERLNPAEPLHLGAYRKSAG